MSSHFGGFAGGRFSAPDSPVQFPHLQNFDGVLPFRDTTVFWRAPWFWPASAPNFELIESYAVADELPGNLPMAVVRSPDWQRRIVLHTKDFHAVHKNGIRKP